MVHSYYKLTQWNNWLTGHPLGRHILTFEGERLAQLLKDSLGKHLVVIGVPQQNYLLRALKIPIYSVLLSPFNENNAVKIEADLFRLPILSGSVDLAILPHTLDFVENPYLLLREACRIVKPEGLIIVCGFNPYSLWGLKKLLTRQHKAKTPWSANFIRSNKIKNWLKLSDFHIEEHKSALILPKLPPKKILWLENIGKLFFPFLGGVYIVVARAKVIPLTPIRLKWKQQLNGIRISPTIRNV